MDGRKLEGDRPAPKIRILSVRGERTPYSDEPTAVINRLLKRPATLNVFTDGPDKVFDQEGFVNYLQKTLGARFNIQDRGDVVDFGIANPQADVELEEHKSEIIRRLAEAKVSTYGRFPLSIEDRIVLEQEMVARGKGVPIREYAESQARSRRNARFRGSFLYNNEYYEISGLGSAYRYIVPEELYTSDERQRNTSLVVTGRGIGQRKGFGIHMRAGFASGPIAVVSTTGLVDAPGKPQEVQEASGEIYFGPSDPERRRKFKQLVEQYGGINGDIVEKILEEIYQDKMLHHGDERINEAVKGISLSMLFFALGEYGRASQCSTTDLVAGRPDLTKFCRIHDSHWQEELLATAMKDSQEPEFCDYHTQLFMGLKAFKP